MMYALIVEDDILQAQIAREHFERLGYHTSTATSLAKARAYLRHRLDLVLIDINLPDGSGLDFAHELRAEPRHGDTDVIVASVADEIPNVMRAYDDAKAMTFISKPIRWRDLLHLLEAVHSERDSSGREIHGRSLFPAAG